MCQKICSDQRELDEFFSKLKLTACPHCKHTGTLIRHGVLRGSGNAQAPKNSVRAHRIYCSNRDRVKGCGRTFSVWLAEKIKRLSLSATQLWAFLQQVMQSDIRVKLFQRCHPPDSSRQRPTELTLAHIEAAFKQHPLCPIAAFQLTLHVTDLALVVDPACFGPNCGRRLSVFLHR